MIVELDSISLCGFYSVELTVDNAESIHAVARGRGHECLPQSVPGKYRDRWKVVISVIQVMENDGLHRESIDTVINYVRIVGMAEKYTLTVGE
ncbi:MAG: hypothetical protein HYX66_09200 [Ignavibacteria bacterium]|nr:hypothetical protein [Ignavibacteria bacterium]